MRDYTNKYFSDCLEQIEKDNNEIFYLNDLVSEEFVFFKYFLISNFYYTATIDNYSYSIEDKNSLLEALYYQLHLITMHDLNWDALEEALNDFLDNLKEFKYICLLFQRGRKIQEVLQDELEILVGIIQTINSNFQYKRVFLVLN
ncbi:barstar family protein [Mucilaginibacter sp.]